MLAQSLGARNGDRGSIDGGHAQQLKQMIEHIQTQHQAVNDRTIATEAAVAAFNEWATTVKISLSHLHNTIDSKYNECLDD
eukprot:108448-Pyramimonas_sp.AAC.1